MGVLMFVKSATTNNKQPTPRNSLQPQKDSRVWWAVFAFRKMDFFAGARMATHPTGPLRYVSGAVNLDDLCLGLRALGLVVLDGRLDGVLCQH